MSKVCEICGKAPVAGRSISHSHRVSNRTFRPNIQTVTIKLNGKGKRANVCTKCLKSNKIERASLRRLRTFPELFFKRRIPLGSALFEVSDTLADSLFLG